MLVEVEFGSIDESRRFRPPAWFGEEVTDNKRYKNNALALHGRPSIPSLLAGESSGSIM